MRTINTCRRLLCAALLALALPVSGASPAKAPGWSLKTPQGETVNFPADAKARPTVLMFWPSWCPFSRALQPYVDDIWKDYRAAGVNVWTLNIKEDKDPVQVMRERGLSFPLLIEADEVARQYGLEYTPWLVVIDGDNRIVYTRPPSPPTPVHTAKEVRAKLNQLLGPGKAVPLPASFPKPYDLHLKDPATLNRQLAPKPVAQAEWGPWVERYLATLKPGEVEAGLEARGAIGDGKSAIAQARELWTRKYGEEVTHQWAPYRAYRKDDHWIVLGDGPDGALGAGLVLVIEAGSGRVIRIARSAVR